MSCLPIFDALHATLDGSGSVFRGAGRAVIDRVHCDLAPTMSDMSHHEAIWVKAGTWVCSIPLAHVVETMRPLPIEPVPGMPPFVRGLSIIRGVPVPVIDLAVTLGAVGAAASSRLVTLRVGETPGGRERHVALAVGAVLGVHDGGGERMTEMPCLFDRTRAEFMEAIGARDTDLAFVLRAARLVPEELWGSLGAAG